jgi:hypothetical protein
MFDAGNMRSKCLRKLNNKSSKKGASVFDHILYPCTTLIKFIHFCTCFNIVNPKDSLSLVKHSLYLGFYIGSCSMYLTIPTCK